LKNSCSRSHFREEPFPLILGREGEVFGNSEEERRVTTLSVLEKALVKAGPL